MSLTTTISADVRQDIFATLIAKMREACFIDWVVGTVFALLFIPSILTGATSVQNVHPEIVWPLVALVTVTRAGDAIKSFAGRGKFSNG